MVFLPFLNYEIIFCWAELFEWTLNFKFFTDCTGPGLAGSKSVNLGHNFTRSTQSELFFNFFDQSVWLLAVAILSKVMSQFIPICYDVEIWNGGVA